jgi:uncharacterized membrane protein affecting hemolysin expression
MGFMSGSPLLYVAIVACLVVLAILLFGIGTFAKGGAFNKKNANKIMQARLIAQAVAVALILFAVWVGRSGG